jgi:exodeoxyribonuclease VII small subunit
MAEKKRTVPESRAEAPPPSFEEAIERLETIVDDLEGGSLSLEESIARYEEGIRLSRQLTQTLDEAEKRIERLVEAADAGGTPTTEPMALDLKAEPADQEGKLPL